tara:strand:+ start:25 stop:618 length:594 start_codon:yes stop_codon:yes gene_type:complete
MSAMNAQLNLIEKPVAIKDYTAYSPNAFPKIILGFKVKNKFDESRTIIKSKYHPKRILHFKWTSQLEPTSLYGIEIIPKGIYTALLSTLENNEVLLRANSYNDCINDYKDILSQYDLSCDECYSYFSDGMYPIDIAHLYNISRKSYTEELNTGLGSMLQRTNYPWFCTLPTFKLFVLTWSNGYNFDYQLNEVNNNDR